MRTAEQEREELVPLVLIDAEVGEDVEHIAHRFAEAVELDDVGMRAVPVSAARRFFTELVEQAARQEEQSRRQEEIARTLPPTPPGSPDLRVPTPS